MLNAAVESWCWKFEAQELADPDLIDKLSLSLCDTCGIESPDFEFNLLISELVTNAIDHGILELNSRLKESDAGFQYYYSERARRLNAITAGWISINAERVDAGTLRISVQDSGAGFDYDNAVKDFSGDERLYGRGLAIIQSLCKSMHHIGCGNCIVVDFEVASSRAAVTTVTADKQSVTVGFN